MTSKEKILSIVATIEAVIIALCQTVVWLKSEDEILDRIEDLEDEKKSIVGNSKFSREQKVFFAFGIAQLEWVLE